MGASLKGMRPFYLLHVFSRVPRSKSSAGRCLRIPSSQPAFGRPRPFYQHCHVITSNSLQQAICICCHRFLFPNLSIPRVTIWASTTMLCLGKIYSLYELSKTDSLIVCLSPLSGNLAKGILAKFTNQLNELLLNLKECL